MGGIEVMQASLPLPEACALEKLLCIRSLWKSKKSVINKQVCYHNVVHFGNRVALEKTFKQDQPKIDMDIALLMTVFDRCYQTALVGDWAAEVFISSVFRPEGC